MSKIILQKRSAESTSEGVENKPQELYSVLRKRRDQNNNTHYGITTSLLDDQGKKIEVKRRINKKMFELLSRSADVDRHEIIQRRYCFLYEKQNFNIDEYLSPFPGLFILRINSNNTEPVIPPFLKVGEKAQDVSTYHLSLKGCRNPLFTERLGKRG